MTSTNSKSFKGLRALFEKKKAAMSAQTQTTNHDQTGSDQTPTPKGDGIAIKAVLTTTELLEKIFSNLEVRDLISLTSTSRKFRAVVKHTRSLEPARWVRMDPQEKREYWYFSVHKNTLDTKDSVANSWAVPDRWDIIVTPYILNPTFTEATPVINYHRRWPRNRLADLLNGYDTVIPANINKADSRREMFLTKPPVKRVLVEYDWGYPSMKVLRIENPSGVTLNNLLVHLLGTDEPANVKRDGTIEVCLRAFRDTHRAGVLMPESDRDFVLKAFEGPPPTSRTNPPR
jgi:hypothetical protein